MIKFSRKTHRHTERGLLPLKIYAILLSSTCSLVPQAVQAQVAPVGEVELEELSVTGEGRTLGGALYGPGGALGAVPGYVASRSTVGTKTDTPILERPSRSPSSAASRSRIRTR